MTKSGLLRTIAGLMILVVFWAKDGFAQDPFEAKSTLAQVRQARLDTFTLEVEVNLPVNVFQPGQGRATRVMRATIGNDVTSIVWKPSDLPAPKYYPPHTPGEQSRYHDAEGNLDLWMWSERATLRDQSVHEEYSEGIGFLVAPDGTVLRRTLGASLYRRRPSDSNTISLNLLRRVLWALGRPWPDSLGGVMSGDLNADGTQRIRAAGSWSPGYGSGAVCELLIEPSNGYLVRQASFGAEGESPRAECRSEGARRFGDVVLAERGEFSLHPIETITVRLVSFSPTQSDAIIEEARRIIARAQTRTVHLFDSREDSALPKHRLVPAGELDDEE